MCVWQLRKIRSTENHLRFDRKISHFEHKIIYALILPSINFRKSHLKRESLSTLLTQSKTHIQAHLSQAPANPAKLQLAQIVPPHSPKPISKLTFKQFLEKKRAEPRARRESKASEIAHTTTPDRTTASNPRAHHNPRSHQSHRTPALARSHP